MKFSRKIALITMAVCMFASAIIGSALMVHANHEYRATERISISIDEFLYTNPGIILNINYFNCCEADFRVPALLQESLVESIPIPLDDFLYINQGLYITITYFYDNIDMVSYYIPKSNGINIEPHSFTCWLFSCNFEADSSRVSMSTWRGPCLSYCMGGSVYHQLVCTRCGAEGGRRVVADWNASHSWSLSSCGSFISCSICSTQINL